MDKLRNRPFTWASWLPKLLAGEEQCWYALWYKSRYSYAKVVDGDRDARLAAWNANHTEMLRDRAQVLRLALNPGVSVEDQNKFYLDGKGATLSGCPDIVYGLNESTAVEDMKSGERRNSDQWQVAIYRFALPLLKPWRDVGRTTKAGLVVYADGTVNVNDEFVEQAKPKILSALATVMTELPPEATPSPKECSRCNIAACPYRDTSPVMTGETDLF